MKKQIRFFFGGAYSVDKYYYRLNAGYGWRADEQASDEIKRFVEQQKPDVILFHTCPFKYEPTEAFLPFVDRSRVDSSTVR